MRRNDSKFTIGKYHMNTMEIIKLLPVNMLMSVTKFSHLTILLFCKKSPFWIFGQFRVFFPKKPTTKIGYFALRKKE